MQQPSSMMFEDDDGVEPQINVVDHYYFEHSEDEPVCFSILPLHFDNNEEVVDCDSKKKVYLRGVLDQNIHVHKRVLAWMVELDSEQPKIFVLSNEHSWITILRARKCYKEKFARSVLITVQMLHFIKKQPRDMSRWARLWHHLHEVFNKLDNKPNVDDLRKHHSLIKLFVERDPDLIKSKILQKLMEDSTKEPKTLSTKAQFIVRVEPRSSNKNDDDKNNYDYNYKEHDSDDEYSCSESSSEDDCSCSENNSNSDDSGDSDTENDDSGNDDSTDAVCAICDDGGKLLGCTGHCKRSFHPRLEDGIESECGTLGYTSAQLKEISDFLCQNCKYKQHQCFKCGELEPSDELNAKVFKCNNASCGHFYHPKCVAKLLEPDDGACELAKSIMSGMSFTCPVHWCFKCGKMEDKTQRELQFAVCRRCPKSYHVECLPRNISFQSKGTLIIQRAWEISDNIFIYCQDHRISKTGTAGRNHIKFPYVQEVSKTNYPVTRKVKTSGNRKMGIHQRPIKSTELPSRSCVEEINQDLGLTVINPEHTAKHLKEDLQVKPSVCGSDPSPSSLETVKGLEGQFGTSPFAKGSAIQKNSSYAVSKQPKNRVMSKADKETSSGISHDITRKRVMPSTLAMYGHTDQDILSGDSLVEKNAERVRIAEDEDDSEREKISECNAGGENGVPNNDFHENHEQNRVLDISQERHAEVKGSDRKSGIEGGMERGDNAYENDSVSGQEKDISTFEKDSGLEKGKVTSNAGNKCDSGSDKVTSDHPPEKPLDVTYVSKATIRNITDIRQVNGCSRDREVNGSYDCQAEPNSSQSLKNRKTIDTSSVQAEARSENQCLVNQKELDVLDRQLKGSGLDSPWCNDENVAADSSKCNFKKTTVPNKKDEAVHDIRANSSNSHVGRNARKRSRKYSPGQGMDHQDYYPETINRHGYEQKRSVNYSGRRQLNPSKSAFSPDFGAGGRQSPPYLGSQEHGTTGRCDHRGPPYVLGPRHSSPSGPRTLDDIDHTSHWDSFHDLEHNEYRRNGRHVSSPYFRKPEYGSSRSHTPPFHPRSPDIHPHRMSGYGTSPDIHRHWRMAGYESSRRYNNISHGPRRSVDIDCMQDRYSPPRLHYGGFSEMDFGPVAGYSSIGDTNDGACRLGMDNSIEKRVAKTFGSVTEKYAPRLDQTNLYPISRSSLH